METLLYDDFDDIQKGRYVQRPPRDDKFAYEKFTEDSAPDLALEVQRVHAHGYKSMGFVNEGAVASDGTLSNDIDKARGNRVEYYAGIDTQSQDDEYQGVAVTLRKVSVPEGGTVADLPAYALCGDTLYEGEAEKLAAIPDPEVHLKEIGALARVEGTNPLATLELIRHTFQEAWTGEPGQTWLLSIVTTTYDTFEDNFGKIAIRRIGDPVKFDDERIGEQIELLPAVVDVDNFLDNILVAMAQEENKPHYNRMRRTVLYLSEGLNQDEMSENVREFRAQYFKMLGERAL